jgi:cellulose synthase/poly-beta-1,6-N-acetylglucosamine synthase-like glycosyltransferase
MYIKYKKKQKYKKKNKSLLKISFCTTCMGRLHHLKKTLPENLSNSKKYQNSEFIVLDYNSSDGLEDWMKDNMMQEINNGRVVYYKTFEHKYFKMSHSKNMAHRLATGDVLFNLDADTFINNKICGYINEELKDELLIFRHSGSVCLLSKFFHKVRGYEEKMIGWGQDDKDLYWRCINFLDMHDGGFFEGMTEKMGHKRVETVAQFDPEFKSLGRTRRYNRRITRSRTEESWRDVNKNGYGCGIVYKNFSNKPIYLSEN